MGCFSNCGSNSCWIIILLLLFCGGGCGSTFSNDGCGCNNSGIFGGNGNDCSCIWIILLLLFFCGGSCGNNSGFVTANNTGCGCNNCNTCC